MVWRGVPKSYAQPDEAQLCHYEALEDWLQRTGQQPAAASAPEGSPEGSMKEEPEDEQPAYTHNYTTQLLLFKRPAVRQYTSLQKTGQRD